MDRRLQIHEIFYLALGGVVTAALLALSNWRPAGLITAAAVVAYAIILRRSERGSITRVLAAYAVTWAFYSGCSMVVDWLSVPLQHDTLRGMDESLFGPWPAGTLKSFFQPWQSDLLALGYMSYHVYLHWVMLDSLRRSPAWREGLSARLFLAFGIGFAGYLLFPAAPPLSAFPELQTEVLAGGFLTRANAWINGHLAARYDAFPSLHVLVTATLLSWDWRHARWRFQIMLVPSLLMLAATLALRLHYIVDLLASAVLFFILALLHAYRLTDPRRTLGA